MHAATETLGLDARVTLKSSWLESVMLSEWYAVLSLVHLAAAIQIVGFLVRDQVILRIMILIGTCLYIAYYYVEPVVPLWDAIICGVLMGVANLYMIIQLLADRRPGIFDEEDLLIYGAIRQIAPGEFRRLLKRAEKGQASDDLVLTSEGKVPEYLYFLLGGEVTLSKDNASSHLQAPMFIGDIAYILNQPASATTTMRKGGRYTRWRSSELRAYLAKQERLQGALEVAFNRDLASKLAGSSPSNETVTVRTEVAQEI